jgi:hypothetical protein
MGWARKCFNHLIGCFEMCATFRKRRGPHIAPMAKAGGWLLARQRSSLGFDVGASSSHFFP